MMNRLPTTEHVADRLHSASIRLLRQLRREDDVLGVSAPLLSALSVLVFGGAKTLGELAAAEQVQPPSMTRTVRKLEEAGLATRELDPLDRRITWVYPTPEGERVLREGRARRVASLAARLGVLDAEELETLGGAAELLERVLRSG
ncbi:MAG TPA: MarR family transcriptional regulator [Longimicrobium sp.]|jgi:DNA-binding MarR family transcriptional regulator